MGDQTITSTEEMVGSGHATKSDTLNRITLVEHHTDGTHECDNVTPHFFAADAEASDTYVITLSPVPTAYTTGMMISFTANTANTGACTVNVNALGAKDIRKLDNEVLDTGDILADQMVTCIYDGTNFRMISATEEFETTTRAWFGQATAPNGWTIDNTALVDAAGEERMMCLVHSNQYAGGDGAGGTSDPTTISVTGQIVNNTGGGGAISDSAEEITVGGAGTPFHEAGSDSISQYEAINNISTLSITPYYQHTIAATKD